MRLRQHQSTFLNAELLAQGSGNHHGSPFTNLAHFRHSRLI
jgi:hypothetical protein